MTEKIRLNCSKLTGSTIFNKLFSRRFTFI